jgi:hypothetical protein
LLIRQTRVDIQHALGYTLKAVKHLKISKSVCVALASSCVEPLHNM